uniref:Uncharacterized protein n=1 Tax=Glossina palpalis gambiensis TaxID=67801 RepID=A0A1B0BIC7_9MUSC
MKENDYIERYKKLARQMCNARHHGVFNLKSLASPYDVIVDTAITLLSNDSLEESKEQGVVIEDVFAAIACLQGVTQDTTKYKHVLTAVPQETRLEKILTNSDKGNCTLSGFYRNLLILSGFNFVPEIIKKLWIKKLSKMWFVESNNKLVKLPDHFREVSNHSEVHVSGNLK